MIQTAKVYEFIQGENGRYLAHGIAALMALLIIFKLFQGLSFFWPDKSQQIVPIKKVKPLQKLPQMSSWHLFGRYQPLVLNTKNLPKTTLNLKLYGVFVAKPKAFSQAIIGAPDGEQKLYQVKADIPGDAKLYRILQNSVIISRAGRLESLSLPKSKLNFGSKPRPLDLKVVEP